MKARSFFAFVVAGILSVLSLAVHAQTNTVNVVTVTNYLTVTVTNVVNVTNVMVSVPLPLPAPVLTTTNGPKYPWQSALTAGLTITRGNSDTLLATVKLLSNKKTPVNEYNLGVDGAYGQNDDVKNNEVLHGFAQWNHLMSEKLYGYLRAEGLHDGIADITYRFTAGPGLGYYLVKEKQTTFAVEGGASFLTQRLGEDDSSYVTLRAAERYEHKFNRYSARFWENAEILPQVDDFENYIVNAEIGIEAAIAKNLSLQVYCDDTYNDRPAAGTKNNDLKLVSGISYKF